MTRTKSKASMTILCHKNHSYIAVSVKTFFLLSLFCVFIPINPGLTKEKVAAKDWKVLYENSHALLKDEKINASKEALTQALEISKEDAIAQQKILKALSIVLTAKACEIERIEESKLDDSRNTFLSGIVIVILAGFILSLLLRYGPQRPKAVKNVEKWMKRNKADLSKDPTSQAAASIFSLLVFALAALGIFLMLMGFLWILSLFSPPIDGHYARATPYYEEALDYLRKSEPLNSSISQATLINNYYLFLESEGKGKKAVRLLRKGNRNNKKLD